MLDENIVGSILESLGHKPVITEAKKKDAEPVKAPDPAPVVETEVHVCPLCESKLEKALDEGKVDTFVNSLLSLDEEDETDTKKKK
jgi:hypothetical protein